MYIAHRLHLEKGQVVLDAGCGVGGPARCIARFAECNVVGLNNNEYQIGRAKKLTKEAGLESQITYIKGDFMHIPVEDNTYDATYTIEATCHAPSKTGVYGEFFRVLKPGGLYASYEWVMTDKYDPKNPEHVRIKKGIEVGNGLPELQTAQDLREALTEVGFEIIDFRDLAPKSDPETPWYLPLSGSFSLSGFKHTWAGRYLTNRLVAVMEWLKIAPTGTTEVSNILMATALDLVEGGKLDIFTPTYFFLVRKPLADE
jgi:sterol 24-C-methyltransferase